MNIAKQVLLPALLTFAVLAPPAHADYREGTYWIQDPSVSVKVKVKEKTRLTLDGWKYVRKVKVKVDGKTVSKHKVKIEVNGSERWPSASEGGFDVYEIGETIDAIELTNVDLSDVVIGGILCQTIESGYGFPHRHGHLRGGESPLEDVIRISTLTRQLGSYVTLDDAKTFLSPIQIQAGRCTATIMARGPFGTSSGSCLQALVAQIDFAQEFLQGRLAVDASYEIAVEMLSLRESVADLLD